MNRDWVKLLSQASAQVHMSHPSGCESLRAGETFNSLEMEAHDPR